MRSTLLADKDALAKIKESLKRQLFYCEAYACTMTKHACYSRRYQLSALQAIGKKTVSGVVSETDLQTMQFKRCVDCKQDWPDGSRDMVNITPRNNALSSGYHSRRFGPLTKPAPEHCPICNNKIDQTSQYRRYYHKHGKCGACLARARNNNKH